MERIIKLAALGAQGAAAGLFAAWLGLVFVTRPVATGGIDSVTHFALAAAALVPIALLALVHVWLGVQLKKGPDSIRG